MCQQWNIEKDIWGHISGRLLRKEIMFYWELKWSTKSHFGPDWKGLERNRMERRKLQKVRKKLRQTQVTILTKSIPSVTVQQVSLLHKAVPLPSLGKQWVIASCSVVWACSLLSAVWYLDFFFFSIIIWNEISKHCPIKKLATHTLQHFCSCSGVYLQ